MACTKVIDLDGRSYVWDGRRWYDSQSFIVPPKGIISRLNLKLSAELAQSDAAIESFQQLLDSAKEARDNQQYKRAEDLIHRALRMTPGHPGAMAILCSVLRARGNPQAALQATERCASEPYAPLLTCRAAALCDLLRWEQAKAVIGRSLAVNQTDEAFSVVHRIKAARPDLY